MLAWIRLRGHERDYEWLASQLPSRPTSESIRQNINGYRRPSWDLAFEIEAVTGISAHDIRDERWYGDKVAS